MSETIIIDEGAVDTVSEEILISKKLPLVKYTPSLVLNDSFDISSYAFIHKSIKNR